MTWLLVVGILSTLLPSVPLAHDAEVPAMPPGRVRVVSWNVLYGFDHGRAVDGGVGWIRQQDPDVLALQELNGFTQESLQELSERFGHPHAVLQKESGFAMGLTSTAPIKVVERRVEGFHHGFLHGRTHGIDFFVVHFWPGKEHEVEIVREKARALVAEGARVVILGDFNSHSETDANFLSSRSPEPRYSAIRGVKDAGFVDVVHRFDRSALYSFPSPITIPKWSKDTSEVDSKRQRIDFILVDEQLARGARSATIVRSEALDGVSDHYPVITELVLPPEDPIPPRFAFGVVADCQYCAAPTRGARRYADSRHKLEACVEHLETLDLAYVVHLGDFIDRDFESFDVVAPIYDSLTCDAHHVLGNHDFSVAEERKSEVPERLGMPGRYYDFTVGDWRFVVLDGNDISLHAHAAGTVAHGEAQRYRSEHAPDAPDWNGAIGGDQLAWLDETLDAADRAGESVVLYCHFPIYPENVHNLWNAAEVLQRVLAHACVKAYMNGHNHAGNYATLEGVHFLTLKGMVDTELTSYGVVEVYAEHLSVLGFGRERDRVLRVR